MLPVPQVKKPEAVRKTRPVTLVQNTGDGKYKTDTTLHLEQF